MSEGTVDWVEPKGEPVDPLESLEVMLKRFREEGIDSLDMKVAMTDNVELDVVGCMFGICHCSHGPHGILILKVDAKVQEMKFGAS